MASSQSGQIPGSVQRLPVSDGAEAFVEMLVANNVEYIFLNSGTDTFPVQEALARMMEQERKGPRSSSALMNPLPWARPTGITS